MGLFDNSTEETSGFRQMDSMGHGKTYRVIDEEAGVVLYGMKVRKGDTDAKGGGFGLTAVPIEDTDLDPNDL